MDMMDRTDSASPLQDYSQGFPMIRQGVEEGFKARLGYIAAALCLELLGGEEGIRG